MERKIQVFTHTDLDGIISPVVLEKVMRLKDVDSLYQFSVTHCETGTYGTIDSAIISFMEQEEKPESIFITDISPSMEVADELSVYCEAHNISWRILDHHKSAQPLAEKYPDNAAIVIRDEETGIQHAGVSLAFQEFTGSMPEVIIGNENASEYHDIALLASIVRSWDTWDWSKDPDDIWKEKARRFELLRVSLGHEKFLARFESGDFYPSVTDEEGRLLDVLDEQETRYIDEKVDEASYGSFTHDGRTYVFSFVTAEQYKSNLGNALSKMEVNSKQVDFGIVFDNGKMSLRSSATDVDVSVIAKTFFNGGGHPMASGGKVSGFDALSLVKEQLN